MNKETQERMVKMVRMDQLDHLELRVTREIVVSKESEVNVVNQALKVM